MPNGRSLVIAVNLVQFGWYAIGISCQISREYQHRNENRSPRKVLQRVLPYLSCCSGFVIFIVRYYRLEVFFFYVAVVAADAAVAAVCLGDRTVLHQLLSTACLVWSASTGAVAFTHKFWQVSERRGDRGPFLRL